ncbi:hypothetical protein Mpsy_0319 [Methanolobus psychrophilus R15]|nr:hypothetical protein Mpsy_0319 [Methanolobus psychrophilus R15]
MNRNDLANEPTVKKLFALISPADRTRDNYLSSLMHYTDFTGLTPTQLIDEANADIRAGKLMIERGVFTRIPNFRMHLESTSLTGRPRAPATVHKYVNCISSFYQAFYVDIPKMPRGRNRTKPLKENLKRADKEDIQALQDVTSLRDNAIMLCGVSSGMGAAEIASLTLQAFKEGYDPATGITTFDMRRRKVGVDFITFISPEASQAVLKYIEWRDRPATTGRQGDILEYEKRRTTPGSYLFVSAKVGKDYLLTRNEEKRQCTAHSIVRIYQRIRANAGFERTPGHFHPVRSHNMRKFFNSNLKNAGCDGDLVEYFMGHTLDGSKGTYYEGDPVKLREIYKKFIPYITIRKDLDVSESPEYQSIKKENVILQAETARHVVERSELSEIRKENEDMKNKLDDMKNMINEAIAAKVAEMLKKQ